MLREQASQKKKQYENKILQFMTKTQQSSIGSEQQTHKSNKKQTQSIIKPQQHTTTINKSQKITKHEQQERKSLHTHGHKSINRKTSLYSLHSHHSQQQPLSHQQNRKQLLDKIESRISQMNQKISQQISKQENDLLNQYAQKLKTKQQQLMRLKKVTNPQMITQKTIQRKQQLQRQKENLIQGNFYLDNKLQQLKNELSNLVEKRDSQKKSLSVLMLDQQLELSQMPKLQSSKWTKKKPVYFSSQDYVEKVLKNYNYKSHILNESLTQSNFKKSQYDILLYSKKHQSMLPRIIQKNQSMTRSINPEYESSEFYSYRKIDKKRFDRAQSTGVFDNLESSIQTKIQIKDSTSDGNKHNKLAKFFRYSKANTNKESSEMKSVQNRNKKDNDKQKTRNISHTSQIVLPKKQLNDQQQHTKQYLQQFVVKKTMKKQVNKSVHKQKTQRTIQILEQKQKILKQKLQKPLKIEELLKSAAEQYYKFKQRHNKLSTQQSRDRQQQEQQNKQELETNRLQQINKKKAQSSLQMNQFDKKIIMDLLLNQYSFKRYLYDLIISEFQSTQQHKTELNLQNVIRNFNSSNFYNSK